MKLKQIINTLLLTTALMAALTGITYAIDTPTNLRSDTPNDLDGHFYMRWDTVSGTVTYELQEGTDPSFSGPYVGYWPYSESANSEYITFKPNGTYYYRIRAWDNFPASGGVSSNWSNTYSVNVNITHTLTTPALTDPGTTSTTGSYSLDWSEPSGATIYEAWEDDNASFSNINQTEFEGTGKYWFAFPPVNFNKPNGTYYYKIRAWTANPRTSPTNCSDSNWSNTVDITVSIANPPNTPSLTDPGTTDTDGNYQLQWTNESASGSTIYELWEDDNSSFTSSNYYWPTPNNQWVTNVNGTYYYRIRAWTDTPQNGGVSSGWSNVVDMVVAITTAPNTPTMYDPGTTDTDGDYAVDWSDENASGATIYELQEDTNSSFTSPTYYWPTSSSQWIHNTINGTYYYRVRAWTNTPENGGLSSGWSSTVDMIVDILGPVSLPVLNDPGDVNTTGNYTVSWSAVPTTQYYTLQEDDNINFTSPTEYNPTTTSQQFSGQSDGIYYYRVNANYLDNGWQTTDWSNTESITVDIPNLPNTPTLTDPGTTDVDGNYQLVWTNESASGATIYELWQDTTTAFTNPTAYWPTDSNENITLTVNGTYYYRVRAWTDTPQNGGVSSGWSNTVDIVINIPVVTPPNIPTLTNPGDTDIDGVYNVVWTNESASGATIYELWESTDTAFVTANYFWPATNTQAIQQTVNNTYYYRVRAWTQPPANGGVSSGWSNVEDIIVDIDTSGEIESVYHDFNSVMSPDNFGGDTGAMDPDPDDDTETIDISLTTDAYESASAMKMDYKIEKGTWVGWWSFMLDTEEGHDISLTANKIKMWVKGAQGGEQFKVELKDTSNNLAAILVGNLDTFYQEVHIPLSLFTGLDFTAIKQLNIVIDSGVMDSEIYIDNIIIAGAGDSAPITVIVDQDLAVDVSGAIDFGILGLNEDVVSSNALVITNSGTINETFYISQLPAQAWIPIMSLPFVPGRNEYVLKGIFNSGSPGIISDESRYVVKIFPESSGNTGGNFAGNINGYDVEPGESRDLWIGFKTPSETSSEETQTILLVITAASP